MDRNITTTIICTVWRKSLSARRAWIEIETGTSCKRLSRVALRKESVDRNWAVEVAYEIENVALRKESVDRNIVGRPVYHAVHVALRKESVDRNSPLVLSHQVVASSLSARRAWIEMSITKNPVPASIVALRKESVDRN